LYVSVNKPIFEDFIEQLLRYYGRWPEPETTLIMDNVSFHYSDRIGQLCKYAGVEFDSLALYTLRTDPIEEFFGEVKTHIKSQRKSHESLHQRDSEEYVKSYIKAVSR
jgi:hypothetical protein